MGKYAENKSKIMTLVELETKNYLKTWAKEEERSLSQLVNILLVRTIKERKEENPKNRSII